MRCEEKSPKASGVFRPLAWLTLVISGASAGAVFTGISQQRERLNLLGAGSGNRQSPPYPFVEQHTADEQHAESKRLPDSGIIA